MKSPAIQLDDLLTVEQFAQWQKCEPSWVRARLATLPGVIKESRKHIRIHPRTYLEGRLKKSLKAISIFVAAFLVAASASAAVTSATDNRRVAELSDCAGASNMSRGVTQTPLNQAGGGTSQRVSAKGRSTETAAPILEADAVKAIIGEAGGESYQCQVAIGEVIRQRGSLKGIYGLHNPCVAKASRKTIVRATAAWSASATSDLTHGCKFFGGDGLDNAYFAKLGKPVAVKIGHVNFYR
jgi:hypothetical protein